MASSFPILFGAPSFGDEDRDQWIRVLQLFLADPFQPHAVNVGGQTQIQYGWTIPAGAISGGSGMGISHNNFGIRELNAFPEATSLALAEIKTISDCPGILLVFGETDNNFAMFLCGYYPGSPPSANIQLLVSGDATDFATYQGSANTFNCYFDSADSRWKVENNFPYATDFYMLFISMGAQI